MNYIGSKLKLSSWIFEKVDDIVPFGLSDKIFCDMFAGTSAIGRKFKPHVKKIISNDMEYYAYVLSKNYIQNRKIPENMEHLFCKLNSLNPHGGFIFQNYCSGGGSGRNYFSDENGKKIDAMRVEIENLREKIGEESYFFLLASLLESADKVANTASMYGAFLKHIKKTAKKQMILKPAKFLPSKNKHEVYQKDSNELIKQISGDILYLDPPYNQRQYGANYHILNTISLYDKFTPKGKTGMRDYARSRYCKKQKVSESFEELVHFADFKYIFLSYNNEGLMSAEDVREIMSKYGTYTLVKKEYQRFKADKTENRNHKADKTFEYLHVLIKD